MKRLNRKMESKREKMALKFEESLTIEWQRN